MVKISPEIKIASISTVITAVIIILGIASANPGVIGNGIILGIFLIAVPVILIRYERYRTVKEIEEKFPIFLRDVGEILRSGMPLHQAIIMNSRLDYGRLSKEVKKMAHQLSWSMPVNKVLDQFTERVKSSRRMRSSLETIRESYASGGDIVSTLESVADNMNQLEDAEKERKSLLNQYVMLMYGISFTFVAIVASINKLLVPIFQISNSPGGAEAVGLANPCLNPAGFEAAICGLYDIPAKYLFAIEPGSIGAYYTSLFFFMSVIVAFSSGLVAGQIADNSLSSGLKHSIIMTAGVVGVMLILKYVNLLGV